MEHRMKALKSAVPYTIPILAGFLFLGFSYGFLMVSKGFALWVPLAMSTIVYAGSMQFAAVPLLLSGFNPIYAFLLTLMVNARHVFYGLSMLKPYNQAGIKKYYLIFAMSDETFSLTYSARPPEGVDRGWFMVFISLLNQLYWIGGTLLGALVGNFVPMNTEGIDFALVALFVVIFIEQWESTKQHIPALIGVGTSLVCLLVFGPERFLLPAMVLIVLLFAVAKKQIGAKEAA